MRRAPGRGRSALPALVGTGRGVSWTALFVHLRRLLRRVAAALPVGGAVRRARPVPAAWKPAARAARLHRAFAPPCRRFAAASDSGWSALSSSTTAPLSRPRVARRYRDRARHGARRARAARRPTRKRRLDSVAVPLRRAPSGAPSDAARALEACRLSCLPPTRGDRNQRERARGGPG